MKKVCVKCHQASDVKPRQTRCKRIERRFGGQQYYCWGTLAVPTAPSMPAGAEPEQPDTKLGKAVLYAAKLRVAHHALEHAITRQTRALTSTRLWLRRVKYYEHCIETIDHPKPPRPKREIRTRKIIVVDDTA